LVLAAVAAVGAAVATLVVAFGPQVGEWEVVLRIETAERLWIALGVGGAEVGADQPEAVELVHRRLVDVQPPRQYERDGEEESEQTDRLEADPRPGPFGVAPEEGRERRRVRWRWRGAGRAGSHQLRGVRIHAASQLPT
jgi:hypothetical protein